MRAIVRGGFAGGLSPWLVVPVMNFQSPNRTWLVDYLHLFAFTGTPTRMLSGCTVVMPERRPGPRPDVTTKLDKAVRGVSVSS